MAALVEDCLDMPIIGYGTMENEEFHGLSAEGLKKSTIKALQCGFRHIDSAELYKSVAAVGEGIKESEVPRSELFISSKLKGMPSGSYESVVGRVRAMLKELTGGEEDGAGGAGGAYFDCLMVHWPGPADMDFGGEPAAVTEKCSAEYFNEHIKEAWGNMLRLKEEGLTKRVGVSNFYKSHLQKLKQEFPNEADWPYCDQIFIDVCHQEKDLVDWMETDMHIKPVAYRPCAFLCMLGQLAAMGVPLEEELQAQVKTAKAESTYQLALAYLLGRGISVVVKSGNLDHLTSNIKASTLAVDLMDEEGQEVMEALGKCDGNEMVDTCGAQDEYAAAFKAAADELNLMLLNQAYQ